MGKLGGFYLGVMQAWCAAIPSLPSGAKVRNELSYASMACTGTTLHFIFILWYVITCSQVDGLSITQYHIPENCIPTNTSVLVLHTMCCCLIRFQM